MGTEMNVTLGADIVLRRGIALGQRELGKAAAGSGVYTGIRLRYFVWQYMPSATDGILVRKCAQADVPSLCELLGLLFAQEADFRPDLARRDRALRAIIDRPEVGQIYSAASGETVVGLGSILFTISTAEGGLAAWLEDMVVHPNWRRVGIGEQLLDAAISGARAKGCSRITLLTDDGNVAAQRFYRRAGFVRSGMVPFRLRHQATIDLSSWHVVT
jgi:ribosomal protein S18 acetylase RimI-like enzyme